METQTANSPRASDEKLTDSPWFWLLAFSACGLLLLEAFGPKYAERQAQIERQHQARQWAQVEAAAGDQAAKETIAYTAEGATEITLWPIRTLALVILCVSATVLWMRRS